MSLGEANNKLQASCLHQVPEHQVPGVQGGAEGDLRGQGHDDPDPGEGAQEEVLASGQWHRSWSGR